MDQAICAVSFSWQAWHNVSEPERNDKRLEKTTQRRMLGDKIMFRNKVTFLGVATVMAIAVKPATAQAPVFTSASSSGFVQTIGGEDYAYKVNATKMDRGFAAFQSGQIILYRTNSE